MLNGLRRGGRLTAQDANLAADLVKRSYALHVEPAAEFFDTEPAAISWFIEQDTPAGATLTELTNDIIALLLRYGIRCREVRCDQVGQITYADDLQVVAVPHTAADWPF